MPLSGASTLSSTGPEAGIFNLNSGAIMYPFHANNYPQKDAVLQKVEGAPTDP